MNSRTITIHDLNRLQGISPDWFALGAKAAVHYALTTDAPANGPLATLLRNPFLAAPYRPRSGYKPAVLPTLPAV